MFDVESPAEAVFVENSEGQMLRASSPCYMPIEFHLNTGATIDPADVPPAAHWIYALHDPRDNPPYGAEEGTGLAYIGTSNHPLRRYAEHMSGAWFGSIGLARKARKQRSRLLEPRDVWILELIGQGLLPTLWLRASAASNVERYRVEDEWRRRYRSQGWVLLNMEGIWIAERTGYHNPPRPTGPLSDDHRKAIGAGVRRYLAENPRPPMDEAAKERLRQANLGRVATEATREKQSEAHLKWWEEHPEAREEAAVRLRKRNLSEEHLRKIREASLRPEVREKRSISNKAHWAKKTPEERSEIARAREATKSLEVRKAAAEKRARTMAAKTPEEREASLEKQKRTLAENRKKRASNGTS